MSSPGCSIPGCGGKHKARGWCGKHYSRFLKHGDPMKQTRPSDWGAREKHPLYQIWCWHNRNTSWYWPDEWRTDFWKFVEDVGPKPQGKYGLRRVDLELPFSAHNFEWRPPLLDGVACSGNEKEYFKQYIQKFREARPDRAKEYDFRRYRAGMSLKKYHKILEAQGGKCAICGKEEQTVIRGKTLKLAVDHCHKTSGIRGLLCRMCNQGLGMFYDSPETLRNAADYLESGVKINRG